MNDALTKNWITTVGGVLAGVPALLTGSGIVLPPAYQKWVTLAGGAGVLLLGVAAKQWNNHSTADQVQAATEAKKPNA